MPQLTYGIAGSTPEFAVFTRSQALTLVEALPPTLLIRRSILWVNAESWEKSHCKGFLSLVERQAAAEHHGALTQLYAPAALPAARRAGSDGVAQINRLEFLLRPAHALAPSITLLPILRACV
jgi:hypothetical protein